MKLRTMEISWETNVGKNHLFLVYSVLALQRASGDPNLGDIVIKFVIS
jgi:hypothetical protein